MDTNVNGTVIVKNEAFKAGDEVFVRDGSYCVGVRPNSLELSKDLHIAFIGNPYVILAVNCDLPGKASYNDGKEYRNNCVLKSLKTGEVVFSRVEYLELRDSKPIVSFKEALRIVAKAKKVNPNKLRVAMEKVSRKRSQIRNVSFDEMINLVAVSRNIPACRVRIG